MPGPTSTMSEPQPDDPFGTALTEIERLLLVWNNLTTAGVSVSAIARLIHQSVSNLTLDRMWIKVTVFFQRFSRLVELYKELKSREIEGTSLITIMAEGFKRMERSHSLWHNDKTPKSALHLLESVDHWTALSTLLRDVYPIRTLRGWISSINGIISLDVSALVALPVQSNVSPDSLRLLEIGAKLLLQTLPHPHRAKISQVIDSQIGALTAFGDNRPGLNYEHGLASHAVLEFNDSQIDLEPHTRNEVTAMNSDQVNTVALKDQIHHLQEQALQLKAVNSGLQQEITSLTEEKTRLEGRVKGRVKLSESEMLGLKSRIKDLQSECAGLEEKLMASKDEHQIAIHKFEGEVAGLQQALDSCNNDDRIYDESFQSRAEKLTEELAEAEEDKAALTRDVDRLAIEKASVEETLAESEDSKSAMSNEIHELGTKNDHLEQALKNASDSLEAAEDDRATASSDVEKLTSENARLQNVLDQISSFSASIRPSDTDDTGSPLQTANANDEADSAASSTGVLTPASSTSTTPR